MIVDSIININTWTHPIAIFNENWNLSGFDLLVHKNTNRCEALCRQCLCFNWGLISKVDWLGFSVVFLTFAPRRFSSVTPLSSDTTTCTVIIIIIDIIIVVVAESTSLVLTWDLVEVQNTYIYCYIWWEQLCLFETFGNKAEILKVTPSLAIYIYIFP